MALINTASYANALKATTGGDKWAGTNYHQDAIDAAKAGDWDSVKNSLALRETKTKEQGNNRGKTSAEIYSELWDQYGKDAELEEMTAQLKELYGQNGVYAQALAQQQAANQAGVQKAVGSLEAQKKSTDQSYANMFKQLYLDKMKAKKNIGQQMAAQGLTGGAAESTLLSLNTGYEDALRQGEQGRITAQDELDKAITDARLTGDITDAQLAADNAKERANSYAGVLQNLINRYDTLNASQTAADREDASNAKAYAYQTVMQILQGGNMASDDLLNSAGISKTDAAAIVAAANRKAAGTTPKVDLGTTSEEEKVIAAISALTQGTEDPLDVSEIRALWKAGYDFSEYSSYIPSLANYYGSVKNAAAVEADIAELIRDGTTRDEVNDAIWVAINNGWISDSEAAALRTKYLH